MAADGFIRVENLSYIYNRGASFEKTALDNINITIRRGEFVGLIGHTGSGKSTLIQHLNALMKPTSGRVFIDGNDINADKSKLKEVRRKVGLVFQYPEHQLFEMTVKKDVAFGPENIGLPPDEVEKRVNSALSSVGISEDLFEKSPFELSGGQKRRVAIAGVLAMNPDVLILDEPAAGLDPRGRDEILERIKFMHKSLGITVLLVSHSMEDIGRLVERVIVINNGKIAMNGTPGEIFEKASLLEDMGLAAPQSTYLMNYLHEKGIIKKSGGVVYTAEEAADEIAAYLSGRIGLNNGF